MAAVQGLTIPTEAATLVVPAAMTAEIIPRPPEVQPLPGAPPWVLGRFSWRNHSVTLISFDRLAADREASEPSRICVFHPLPGRPSTDYFALAMHGDPRSVEITDSAVAGSRPGALSPRFVAGVLSVNERALVIPDFDALHSAVSE